MTFSFLLFVFLFYNESIESSSIWLRHSLEPIIFTHKRDKGMTRRDDTIRYDLIWYDMMWYDMIYGIHYNRLTMISLKIPIQ